MRRDRMTYDDFNELFWSRSCLNWQPIVTEPRCVTSALQHCSKTHVESYSWLHVGHTFLRPLVLSACLTYAILVFAYCEAQGARNSLGLQPASPKLPALYLLPVATV